MKIWAISLCLLVLLGGCDTASELERGMALRSSVLGAEQCSMDVHISADYGNAMTAFSVGCRFDKSGKLYFSVLNPESIEGISGNISADKGMITFDDTVLYFDLLSDGQLSPVSAPWIFMKALRGGYLRNACMEAENLRITVDDSYNDDALQLDIWLNSENNPKSAEILFQGRRILSMKIENFRIM